MPGEELRRGRRQTETGKLTGIRCRSDFRRGNNLAMEWRIKSKEKHPYCTADWLTGTAINVSLTTAREWLVHVMRTCDWMHSCKKDNWWVAATPSMGVFVCHILHLTSSIILLSLICRLNLWSVGMPWNKRWVCPLGSSLLHIHGGCYIIKYSNSHCNLHLHRTLIHTRNCTSCCVYSIHVN